ncbi:hypothetical protein ROU88_00890 [Macrococcus capreoli]|nr:hypothetical protein [Macrococcus sp. TMW 2.2395]MCU7556673.1 hypothetical protein [Macrococcus sp. TMW 2.2395]
MEEFFVELEEISRKIKEDKKKILMMRLVLYLFLYLIGFAIFAISKN